MCFSAAANFVGSGVLGAVGVVTLTKVKHQRELLFAALPTLFAIHQFIEGFVWLGLDRSSLACRDPQYGCGLHAVCAGTFAFPVAIGRAALRTRWQKPQTHAAFPRHRRCNGTLHIVGDWPRTQRRFTSRKTALSISTRRQTKRPSRSCISSPLAVRCSSRRSERWSSSAPQTWRFCWLSSP